MSHSTWNLPIEDYSCMTLRSPQAICTIETSDTFPDGVATYDQRHSIRTTRHNIIVRGDNVMEVYRVSDGHVEQYSVRPGNAQGARSAGRGPAPRLALRPALRPTAAAARAAAASDIFAEQLWDIIPEQQHVLMLTSMLCGHFP